MNRITLYTFLALVCDFLHLRHSWRRRIGGIRGAQTKKARIALKCLAEAGPNSPDVNPGMKKFLRCIDSGGYPEALEPGEQYEWINDPVAESAGLARVKDDSGEDYLYPRRLFAETTRDGDVG